MEMKQGKIYWISFGGTQILGRFKYSDTCNHYFESYLHYWAGSESFKGNEPYCVKHGIEDIRRATPAEKHSLLKFEIEHETI
jgi:hypothetical protein